MSFLSEEQDKKMNYVFVHLTWQVSFFNRIIAYYSCIIPILSGIVLQRGFIYFRRQAVFSHWIPDNDLFLLVYFSLSLFLYEAYFLCSCESFAARLI